MFQTLCAYLSASALISLTIIANKRILKKGSFVWDTSLDYHLPQEDLRYVSVIAGRLAPLDQLKVLVRRYQ